MQTLFLGLMGGSDRGGLGVGVQMAFPVLLRKLVNMDTTLHIQMRTVLTGLRRGC